MAAQQGRPFDDDLQRLGTTLRHEVAKRQQAEAGLAERERLADLRGEVGAALTGRGTLAEMLRHCTESMVRYLDAAFARIWVLNPATNVLELQASAGLHTHLNGPHSRIPVGHLKIGRIAAERRPRLTNRVIGDRRIDQQDWAIREGMVAFAGYPLIVDEHVVGVVAMFARQRLGAFTLRALAAVADNIALGIQRKLTEELLDRANRLKLECVATMSHELTQPLSSISNGVEACARLVRSGRAETDKLLEILHSAAADVLRAGDIVQHLRRFIQKGEPQFEPTDLRGIARSVPHLLGHEIKRTRITLRLNTGVRPLPIHADRIQIEQVVVNLIQNAIDAVRNARRRRKEIQLRLRVAKGVAEVSVHDTGVGVSAAAAERMFEPFFTTKPQGLGMGLAISRTIIEAHGGRIWAEADRYRGTTLRFTLPLRQAREQYAT